MQPLLDATIEYLACANDLGALAGQDPKIKEPIERRPEADEPFSAFVFKTIVDPFAGKLSIFRVVSGKVTPIRPSSTSTRTARSASAISSKLDGKKQAPVAHAVAGEIVAVAKLKDTATGDTLADEKAPILYPGLHAGRRRPSRSRSSRRARATRKRRRRRWRG